MRRPFLAAALLAAALGALRLLAAAPEETGAGIIRRNVAVPMRDHVVLRADVMLPAETGRFPVLVYRTPYGKKGAPREWTTFRKAVARGYAVVVQDVRGRYESEGDFDAYRHEGTDGYDTIEWAAAEPWSNGEVGTFGLSYPGAVQWLAAVEDPPHLKAMVPAMTFSTPRNFFYSGGVFDGSWVDWVWFNIAPDLRRRKGLPGPATHQAAAEAWKAEHARVEHFLPLRDLPDFKGLVPFYYEWLEHPPADRWWDWAELQGKYHRVHAAVLNISGWYDEAYGPDGATANFNGLVAARKGRDPRTRTVIGPWKHGELGSAASGERDFGAQAPVDYDEMILRWMDHYLKGLDNGVEKEKPVRLFVMGANQWRDEEAWPIARARDQWLVLGAVEPGSRTGVLAEAPPAGGAAFLEFTSDPAHPLEDPYDTLGAHDYQAYRGREDVLVFDSAPLPADLEVTGGIRAEIYVSTEARDFDLWARVLDVGPDGKAWNLMSPGPDVLRASYGLAAGRASKERGVYRMTFPGLLTSNVFARGHRIRLQISGSFMPHFSRNLQTGRSESTSRETRRARIRVLSDPEHPSRVAFPVVPARPA